MKKLVNRFLSTRYSALVYSFVISTIFLLIRSKCSPLYPFNDWDDANCFLTVGKAIFNGVVPYRDLFEQKGPILFVLYGLASLISYKTFLGAYLLEVVFFTVFLYYSYKIVLLFTNRAHTIQLIPIIAFLVLSTKSFVHGGSAEEICLPLITISLYYLIYCLTHLNIQDAITNKVVFMNGIIAGSILWIKFSLLGFWIAWIIMLSLPLLLNQKFLKAIRVYAVYLLGMVAITLPLLLYFGLTRSIGDLFNTYFIANIKYYTLDSFQNSFMHSFSLTDWVNFNISIDVDSSGKDFTLFKRILYVFYQLFDGIWQNKLFGTITLTGIAALLFSSKNMHYKAYIRYSILVLFFMLALGIYLGGVSQVYYFFVFTPVVIFGVVFLSNIIHKYLVKHDFDSKLNHYITGTLILVISTLLVIKFNHNKWYLTVEKNTLIQYTFLESIPLEEKPSLLTFGSLDIGLYTTSGIVPEFRYFQQNNFKYENYPYNRDEQLRYIREGLPDFVIAQANRLDEEVLQLLDENYILVRKEHQFQESYGTVFELFKRKNEFTNNQ